MPNAFIAALRRLVAALLLLPMVSVGPALAQTRIGNDPEQKAAAFTTDYTRYYAPYALQAAAAYIPMARFEALRGPNGKLLRDGSDVDLAVTEISALVDAQNRPDVIKRATKYLRPWKYEFGHTGYMSGCLYNDPDCERIRRDEPYAIPILWWGPGFHVWARYGQKQGVACSEVSIAFRGTNYGGDWIGSLNPLRERIDDHYRQLRRNIDGIINRIIGMECYQAARRRPQIVSVGHSLGAGLAVFAGLANRDRDERITKVFAFNASPVEGVSVLNKELVRKNAARLEVDQLHQPGEGLQYARALVGTFKIPTPGCLRAFEMGVLIGGGPKGLHAIDPFAGGIVQASYDDDGEQRRFRTPKRPKACKDSIYQAPTSDEDLEPAPPTTTAPLISSAPAASAVALGRLDRERMIDRDVRANAFGTADLHSSELNGATAQLAGGTAPRSARAATRQATRLAEPRMPAVRFDTQAALLRD